MATSLGSLVKDTAVYGMSSMVGRFLNWLLTFVYVQVLLPEEVGQMTNLYAATALLLVVLTYGMETAFFRYVNRHTSPKLVYATTLKALFTSSLLFVVLGYLFAPQLSTILSVEGDAELLGLLCIIVASDAFMSIPLGYLRYANRPWLFVGVRIGFVLMTIVSTLVVFYLFPYISEHWGLTWIYNPNYHLFYILAINLFCNVVQLIILVPTLLEAKGGGFSWLLLKQMLLYAWPILLLGLVGALSNQADKLIFPRLFADIGEGNRQLGIYGACYKLAVVMLLFTQAFRYAYDPFVFSKSKEGEEVAKQAYADAMKYYYIFSLVIFLGVMSYLDILKLLLTPTYYDGLVVVPYVMAGQLMFGIYSNLSVWYKLTDRTVWGAVLSIVGCVLMLVVIVWGVPYGGFMACAWASVISNGAMMLLSYVLGQYYYPIRYDLMRMGGYTLLLVLFCMFEQYGRMWYGMEGALLLVIHGGLLLLFVVVVVRCELPKGFSLSEWRRYLPGRNTRA